MRRRFLDLLLLPVMAAALSGTANAASDGNLATSSTGTVQVSAQTADMAKISGLQDISLGPIDARDQAYVTRQNVCVYSSTGAYSIELTSSNGSSTNNKITNGAGQSLTYTVGIAESANASAAPPLPTDGPSDPRTNTTMDGPDCSSSGANATLVFAIPSNVISNNEITGSYTDSLSITLRPE